MKQSAFTIVELIIVVVVIGILATVTLMSYGSVKKSAVLAKVQTDLAAINDGIKIYHAKKGQYPAVPGGASCVDPTGFASLPFAEYIDNVPTAPCTHDNNYYDSYMYASDPGGTGYKLIHFRPSSITAVKDQIPHELRDPENYNNAPEGTWGYWTDNFKTWQPGIP